MTKAERLVRSIIRAHAKATTKTLRDKQSQLEAAYKRLRDFESKSTIHRNLRKTIARLSTEICKIRRAAEEKAKRKLEELLQAK